MALSIRSPELETLVRTIAVRTKRDMTSVILAALKDQYQRLELGTDRLGRLRQLAANCAQLPTISQQSPNEILGYSETGTF